MTDEPTSPAAEAAVRARLAEARHTDPAPDHVVARLDAVLADLTAERRQDAVAPVVPLSPAPARRRRALATGLVAAAAVVALGVALPQVLDSTSSSDDATSASTDDSGGSEARPDLEAAPDGGAAESAPSEDAERPGASSDRSGSAYAAPLELSSGEQLRPVVRPLARRGAVTAYDARPGCALDLGAGDRVDATWDGAPAVVVLRPPEAGRRVVVVYLCGSDEVVGRTTVPSR